MSRDQRIQERELLTRGLPPIEEVLRASLFERFLRCGKQNCHCAGADDPGHRVAYVGLSLPGGKTSQVSLPQGLVPVAERWIANYRQWQEAVEQISAINHELLRRRWVEPPPAERRRRGRR